MHCKFSYGRNQRGIKSITILAIGFALMQTGLSASQPNDNFADRILLSGDDIVFAGDLTSSTIEANEPTNAPMNPWFAPTHSVWWSWTATQTTPVTIVALNYSEDTYTSGSGGFSAAVAVYAVADVFASSLTATTNNAFWLDAAIPKRCLTFPAVAGTSYQIQFFGTHPTLSMVFRLIATNPPVLLEPPTTQATFPGGSALFTVLATSLSPIGCQWCFQGTELPGKTSPMLALNNLTVDQAGAYSVVVTNATGAVTSAPASLQITATAAAPTITATGSPANSFAFTLSGEAGRYYRILSSPDLADWQNEGSFSSIPVALAYPSTGTPKLSVVYSATASNLLSIPGTSDAKFVRAQVYAPDNEVCINNLKQIRFAKQLRAHNDAMPLRNGFYPVSDLLPEITNLYCPVIPGPQPISASYVINDNLTPPACKIVPTHLLEEP
jgi:hypothetical protein